MYFLQSKALVCVIEMSVGYYLHVVISHVIHTVHSDVTEYKHIPSPGFINESCSLAQAETSCLFLSARGYL